MTPNSADNQDSESLEALFDSIIASNQPAAGPAPAAALEAANEHPGKVFTQLGVMARALHDTLRELGFDKNIETVTSSIPDARDRLSYVAAMTQQAAERVLNATDAAQPIMNKLEADAQSLSAEWQKLFERQLSVDQFKALAARTRDFLESLPKQAKATNAFLLEIMMAQDFQDLTGQVIKKILELTQLMEQQLLALLVESAPASFKLDQGLLNGPVINPQGNPDVVTSQDQVDELLESLGF